MKYRFIDAHRSAFGVGKMCRLFALSRSGFYRWDGVGESKRTVENRVLLVNIKKIYHANKGRYGSPRITDELQDQGHSCSRPRVARLMRKHSIKARAKRRYRVTTDSQHKYQVAPNLLKQDFQATAPNRVWVSDITYIRTLEGWLYLTVVLDLYNRKIIGWSMSDRMQAKDTTVPAYLTCPPKAVPVRKLVFGTKKGGNNAYQAIYAGTNHPQTQGG